MSTIHPVFISPDLQQWVIAINSEEAELYICSSTKFRNAIKQAFKENSVIDAEAIFYKDAANIIINAIKTVTEQKLEAFTYSDGNGKFLTIAPESFEHNFEPTHEADADDEPKLAPVDIPAKKITPGESDNWRIKQRAEIRARLQKLADQYES